MRWSWELAGAPKMAAGTSPPTDLDKSPLDPPQSRLLGPNWIFEHVCLLKWPSGATLWAMFQEWKTVHLLPATSYAIPAFHLEFIIKNAISRNPMPPFHVATPPIFIDFLLTNSSRKKRSPFHRRGGEGGEGWLATWIWAVRSGR